jgi:hypothetical protein
MDLCFRDSLLTELSPCSCVGLKRLKIHFDAKYTYL